MGYWRRAERVCLEADQSAGGGKRKVSETSKGGPGDEAGRGEGANEKNKENTVVVSQQGSVSFLIL